MSEKINILLIDDDEASNFFHRREILKAGIDASIETVCNGEEATILLQRKIANGTKLPDVIFLDINMPRMSGWEFLLEYDKLVSATYCKRDVIVMLSTSNNLGDATKAYQQKNVKEYRCKPLVREDLAQIIERCRN